jgi:hypothetical protein
LADISPAKAGAPRLISSHQCDGRDRRAGLIVLGTDPAGGGGRRIDAGLGRVQAERRGLILTDGRHQALISLL